MAQVLIIDDDEFMLRVILILPDADPQTIARGHNLRPRYLSNIQSDFQDVAAVLRKMLAFPEFYAPVQGDQHRRNSPLGQRETMRVKEPGLQAEIPELKAPCPLCMF